MVVEILSRAVKACKALHCSPLVETLMNWPIKMINYDEARVCLFDPAQHNILVTRASLVEIGFSNIDMSIDFSTFSEEVSNKTYDLIIAESHDTGGAVGGLMRKIRTGEIGDNPFVIAITTSWNNETDHIQNLVDAGIDDILLRPFSTQNLQSRLGSLVDCRKNFVVTSDYIGPDRRDDAARKTGTLKAFTPPNTLKAATVGDTKSHEKITAEIITMKADVTKERVRRLAMKIVVSMQVKLDNPEAGEALDMEAIDATARELRRRLRRYGAADAVELASALTEITTEILDPDAQSSTQFKLVRELAQGAYTAFAGGEAMETEASEVQNTVNALRNKLQAQLISDYHSG